MSTAVLSPAETPAAPPRIKWIVNGPVDLLVGCGAWTLPLLAATFYIEQSGVLAVSFLFYFLTVFCNNPHYFATIQRAYGTPQDFRKYRFFTVYVTILLVATAALAHAAPVLLPILFTIYLTWSPWHYTGQNYGIGMMYIRRAGASPDASTRQLLYGAHFASYLMWFLSIHSTFTENPYVWTLGIPQTPATISVYICLVISVFAAGIAMGRLVRQVGIAPLLPAFVLLSTQFFWFVLPVTLQSLDLTSAAPVYFSTGALAFMHCAQYIWITQFYARRESVTHGTTRWTFPKYYGGLILGGIALFLPGPWLMSRAFQFNLVDSYLIFTALVNIHHFLLDGAIWKLRDGRIASLLLGSGKGPDEAGNSRPIPGVDWFFGPALAARGVRYGLGAGLVALALVDIRQYALTMDDAPMEATEQAAAANPYDARVTLRQARALLNEGRAPEAIRLLTESLERPGYHPRERRLLGVALVADNRFDQAWQHYEVTETVIRPDLPTLVNVGTLAAQRGDFPTAYDRFLRALDLDPENPTNLLNLAELHYDEGQFEDAALYYITYIQRLTEAADARDQLPLIALAGIKLGDCYLQLGRFEEATTQFATVAEVSSATGQNALAARALGQLAELHAGNRSFDPAASAYRLAIVRAGEASDAVLRSIYLYNYARLLLEARGAEREAYALLRLAAETKDAAGLSDQINEALNRLETDFPDLPAMDSSERDRLANAALQGSV